MGGGGQLDIRPPNLKIGGDVSPPSPSGLTPLVPTVPMDRLFRWQCILVLSRRSRSEILYYRWCIDLFIGTSGEELFTDGKLPLPSVPMDKVFEGYLMPLE